MEFQSEAAKDPAPMAGVLGELNDSERIAKELARRQLFGESVEANPITIGRFEIRAELGRGGMGRVYLAVDPLLGRQVAIKVLHESYGAGTEARERLVREAAAMAAIRHPNTVPVFEVGQVRDQAFVAMEYVEGQNLRQWCKAQTPAAEALVRRIVDVAHGLHAAHAAGIVHRDVKPENILIGDDGRTRVTDFGLARAPASSNAPDQMRETLPEVAMRSTDAALFESLTATGAVLGTPAYMSPEQLSLDRVTTATDQYSLCLTLYEGLTGHRLHQAESVAELAIKALDTQAVVQGLQEIPSRLRPVLRKGLALHAEDRFDTVLELATALEAALAPERGPTWRGLGRGISRRLTSVGGLAALGVVTALGAAAWKMRPPASESDVGRVRAVASTRAVDAGAPGCGSEATAKLWTASRRRQLRSAFESSKLQSASVNFERIDAQMADYSDRLASLLAQSCDDAPARRCLDWRTLQAESKLDVLLNPEAFSIDSAVSVVRSMDALDACMHPELRPTYAWEAPPGVAKQDYQDMRADLARAQALNAGWRFDEATSLLDALQRAANEAEAHGLLAEIEMTRARIDHLQRRLVAEAEHLALAYDHAKRGGHTYLAAEAGVATVLFRQHSGADLDLLDNALNVARAAVARSEHPRLQVKLASAEGRVELRRGNPARALELQQSAVNLARERFPAPDEELAYALDYLGGTYAELGRADEAFAAKRAAIETMEKVWGPKHASMEVLYRNIGNIGMLLGDRPTALEGYETRLEIQRAQFGALHPRGIQANYNVAKWWSHEGDFERAQRYLDDVMEIGGEDPAAHYLVHRTLAENAGFRRDAAAMRTAIEDLNASVDELGDDAGSLRLAELAGLEAKLARLEGQPRRAEALARTAAAEMRKASADPRDGIESRTELARALLAQDELEAAARELDRQGAIIESEIGILPRARIAWLAASLELAHARRDDERAAELLAQLDARMHEAYGARHPLAQRVRAQLRE